MAASGDVWPEAFWGEEPEAFWGEEPEAIWAEEAQGGRQPTSPAQTGRSLALPFGR